MLETCVSIRLSSPDSLMPQGLLASGIPTKSIQWLLGAIGIAALPLQGGDDLGNTSAVSAHYATKAETRRQLGNTSTSAAAIQCANSGCPGPSAASPAVRPLTSTEATA